MNKKQQEEKRIAIVHMRSIMELYDINNTKEVRHRLADDYNTVLSDSTVKRYRKIILAENRLTEKTKRLEQKKINKVEKAEIKAVEKQIKNHVFPLVIRCPANKKYSIQSEITSITLFWKRDGKGDNLVWGPISQNLGYWHWHSDGRKYGTKRSGKPLGGSAPLTHEND